MGSVICRKDEAGHDTSERRPDDDYHQTANKDELERSIAGMTQSHYEESLNHPEREYNGTCGA